MGCWKKALIASAFFIACHSAFALTCAPVGGLQEVGWQRIYDGDTLLLEDGRRLRLLGINTPEMGREGRADEVGALAAKSFVERLLAGSRRLYIDPAVEDRDRYGRLLARVYLGPGRRNLSELLLEQGLGALVVVPPNGDGWQCLAAAEQRARLAGLGIWSHQPAPAATVSRSGFYVLRGRISGGSRGGDFIWLELDEHLVLRVSQRDRQRFSALPGLLGEGRRVEVRGWVIDRQARGGTLKSGYRRWMLPVRHPAMIRIIQ
ncbi:thermonuclease family protein [Aestuariirhabdus sp. LZHN29]|uniref:thermonuclease family protein n=1 Tax=Aestuariirhabdus sp. LZHN29 TaxID=3417462 RepID=UPI003CF5E77E